MITKTKNFFGEVRAELAKASWPWESKDKGIRRYKELTDSTLVNSLGRDDQGEKKAALR